MASEMTDLPSSALRVVELTRHSASDVIAEYLENLAQRARDGEFQMVAVIALRPDFSWQTSQAGANDDPLRFIGLLESIKADLLADSKKQ